MLYIVENKLKRSLTLDWLHNLDWGQSVAPARRGLKLTISFGGGNNK